MLRRVLLSAASLILVVLGLLMAGCDDLADIGLEDAGWKTYRNADFGYEVSYPREWQVEVRDPQPDDSVETQWVRVSGKSTRRDVAPSDESVLVAVNFQAGWCNGAARVETKEIAVGGVPGIEYDCYHVGPECRPQPNCQAQPYGIVRFFEGAQGKQNYIVIGDPTSDPLLVRRIIETFRFVEASSPAAGSSPGN
jgi:hypothetical protein